MKRPIPVIFVSLLYIVAGSVGLVYHLQEWTSPAHSHYRIVWFSIVRVLAVIAGIYVLRARNWARWLAVAWMGFHVVISLFHPWTQLLTHALLMVVITIALFTRTANQYFA